MELPTNSQNEECINVVGIDLYRSLETGKIRFVDRNSVEHIFAADAFAAQLFEDAKMRGVSSVVTY